MDRRTDNVRQRQRSVEDTREIFNDMADEYDDLRDLWYSYTFGTIDRVLQATCAAPDRGRDQEKPIAFDVGCGTGIQSLRLASLGYRVIGIDVADRLLDIARAKLESAGYTDAEFHLADAQELPFGDGIADLVNCCGPVLSFIPDWRRSLAEMARCTVPGGKLILEVEGKWTCDLLWTVVNAMCFNIFGYDTTLRTALRYFRPPWHVGHSIDYSFKLESGEAVMMPLKLFTERELRSALSAVGYRQQKRWGLHFVTNLIPSTILHGSEPGRMLRATFRILSAIERSIYTRWPFHSLGCSHLVLAEKDTQNTLTNSVGYDLAGRR